MEEIVDLGKFTSDGAGASLLWEPIMCGAGGGGNRNMRECLCREYEQDLDDLYVL